MTFLCLFLLAAFSVQTSVGQGTRELGNRTLAATLETATAKNPAYGNWGDWHGPTYCPEGMWAVGAAQRINGEEGNGDDTALNAIRLICAPLGKFKEEFTRAEPHEGYWGDWSQPTYCPDSIIVGFDLRADLWLGRNQDDVAATSLKIICSSGHVMELANGLSWGTWTGEQRCPRGSAVCGASVQMDKNWGRGEDDTALNNVRMSCCDMVVPEACTEPKDGWQKVEQCQNGGAALLKCKYEKKTGVQTGTSQSRGGSEQVTKSVEVQAQVGVEFKALSASFSTTVGHSGTTGTDWSSASSETFSTETVRSAEFDVLPGHCSRLEQVVGTCGGGSKTLVFNPSTRIVAC